MAGWESGGFAMPCRGMPYQGMPYQGMPGQGMACQGMPYQGMAYQGMPYQGMPYQGMPNQGMPYQGPFPGLDAKAGGGGGGDRAGGFPAERQSSFERMEWFQSFLNALWPAIRGMFERDVLRGALEPKLASKVPGLRFGGCYLGDRPPELHGVRTKARGNEEVQVTLDLGFHPGNSIDISLVFGAIKAGIAELEVQGQLCISLIKVVPRKPVVCGVKIYFANAPTISFNFSGLAAALPVPPQKIKELIQEVLASKLVLPNAIDVHVDSIARCFGEPDFLDYHELNSPPPVAVLRLSVASMDGPLVHSLGEKAPSVLGMLKGRAPSLYALIRVGGQQQRTEPHPRERDMPGLSWTGRQHDFIVDSLADQDVYVELYSEDHGRMVQCDKLLAQAKISARQLARELSDSSRSRGRGAQPPFVRLTLASTDRRSRMSSETCTAVLTGGLLPLQAQAPPVWANAEALLLISVDCVIGLDPVADGRRFKLSARLLPEQLASNTRAATPVKKASRDQVTEARVLHTALEEAPLAAARERLQLLYDRGARLSADDAAFVLAGLVGKKEAALLLEEIESDKKGWSSDRGVEVLFGDQLRLQMGNPRDYGLRIELLDEERKASVGVLEWSSLAFLAKCEYLEDDLQAYALERASLSGGKDSDALTLETKVYLKRSLRVLGAE